MSKQKKEPSKPQGLVLSDGLVESIDGAQSSATFEKERYLTVRNLVSSDLASLAAQYSLVNEKYKTSKTDSQVPNNHSVYSDFLMESMLLTLQPKLERLTGLSLYPTYSYYRVYRPGAILKEHVDRESCEISCSLCLGYDYLGKDYCWRIKMGNAKVGLEPGDAVIYRGMELPHSRAAFQGKQGAWHSQVFLHWVEASGPCQNFKFDRRGALYLPPVR